MPETSLLIPEITDEDIEWARTLMHLDVVDEPRRAFLKSQVTQDVSACPGSGKTTLIVAKLAILAKKWRHRAKGICVVSHTNVAREEIQRRLGGTVVGQKLLTYPHFIGTIHGFVDQFLALPWLYSNGFPVVAIDDDVTSSYRRRFLGQDYYKIRAFLENKRCSFEQLRISARDFSFDLSGKAFPAGPSAPSYGLARRAVETSANAGYFCYDEMFVWAKALLEDYPDIPSVLVERFPLVFIDEMQDTSEKQGLFLNSVFPRQSRTLVLQRVGDPNQAIFDGDDFKNNQTDPFPDRQNCIEIPNSFRFGQQIANFASPLAVREVSPAGLSGVGPKGHEIEFTQPAHAIFLFPHNNTAGVLDAFGRHVLHVLPDALLREGLVAAVGAVHREAPDIPPGHAHFPKTVSHYWSEYRVDVSRKDPNPRALAQYVWVAQALAREKRDLYPGLEKIAFGLVQLADRIGDVGNLKRTVRSHRALIGTLEPVPQALESYRRLISTFLIEQSILTSDSWRRVQDDIAQIARALCRGETNFDEGRRFLDWPADNALPSSTVGMSPNDPGPNVYPVSADGRQLDIRLGSIHSVKGQTHVATMVLDTYWNAHAFKRLLPWLLGVRKYGNGAGPQDHRRLLQTYVAMTRPSHLLCLAMRRSTLEEGDNFEQRVAALQQQGWLVAELVDGIPRWKP